MEWRTVRTGFFCNGKLRPFSTALDFARFPLLNPIEKARFGLGVLRAAGLESPESIEDLTCEQWLTQLSGKSVFEKLWRPLLRAKLGEEYSTTSAVFVWATIRRLYAARRSGLRQEMFGYIPGGYSRTLTAFAAALKSVGVEIRVDTPVAEVRGGRASVEVIWPNGIEHYDCAVVTVPAPLAARMCPRLTPHELRSLRAVEYLGVVCPSLLLRRPLSEYYVTNIADSAIPLTGVIEMTALVDRRTFGGRSLVYLPRYLRPDDSFFDEPDAVIREQSMESLRRIHPSLQAADVLAFRVSRARYVFPRPAPGFSRLRPPIDTSIPNVHILNAAHIPAGTLNVDETVRLARSHARRLMELHAHGLAA
jgi:protoporphyrinogen oxidase